MTSKSVRRASAVGVSIATVGLLGLASAPIAGAQSVPSGPVPAAEANLGTIDSTTPAVLHVHKYKTDDAPSTTADDSQDGNQDEFVAPDGAEAVVGATFNAFPVLVDGTEIDLSTNEGWTLAQDFAAAFKNDPNATSWTVNGKEYTLGASAANGQTAADGSVDLNLGTKRTLVVVKEDVSTITSPVANQWTSIPFAVTVPLLKSDRTTWNYEPHVYPKNQPSIFPTPTKELNDDNAQKSDDANAKEIVYSVKQEIPDLDSFQSFRLIDPLTTQLQYTGAGKDVIKIGDTVLDAADYEIVSTTIGSAPTASDVVTVTFTASGLAKLAAANAGDQITWELHTELREGITADADTLVNKAFTEIVPPNGATSEYDPNNPPFTPPTEPGNPPTPNEPTPGQPPLTPTNTVETYYGSFQINKTIKGSEDLVAGAKFKLYECLGTESADELAAYESATDSKDDRVQYLGEVGPTVAGEGLKVTGILVNDFRDNAEVANPGYYCLVETVAPEGSEKLPEPIKFQVTKANAQAGTVTEIAVENPKRNGGFELPLTGGAGIAPLVVVGGLLIVGSGAYVAAASRRKKNA